MVAAYHCRAIAHPEEEEQELLPSLTSTGVDGAVADEVADRVKVSTADHAETSDVLAASRAWTRQYQVPWPRVTVQLVPEIQPDV